jgi:hypothetical protein
MRLPLKRVFGQHLKQKKIKQVVAYIASHLAPLNSKRRDSSALNVL